ncbi:MAG: hypothetical protein OEU92_17575 [Alphaproteobacteria bacterium]|nr:hypothetical protein [Alphaproteobacteria bacterium]
MRMMITVLGLVIATSMGASAQGTVDKARLQAAMQQHIERHTVDGAMLHFDPETGEVKPLYPTQAHPMVIAMGEHFVLCTDLRDKSGKAMPLDLYMARKGRSYVVFHSEIDNRSPLQRLMKDGIARPLR